MSPVLATPKTMRAARKKDNTFLVNKFFIFSSIPTPEYTGADFYTSL
jgi:hypothetical protein